MVTSSLRAFNISDEGDEFQVQLFQGGVQVAGVLVPFGPAGCDAAFSIAREIGEAFSRNDKAP